MGLLDWLFGDHESFERDDGSWVASGPHKTSDNGSGYRHYYEGNDSKDPSKHKHSVYGTAADGSTIDKTLKDTREPKK